MSDWIVAVAGAAAVAAALKGWLIRRRLNRRATLQAAAVRLARLRAEGHLAINPDAAFRHLLDDHPELRTEDST